MNANFEAFIKKIKLTDPQKDDAKTKIKNVCETLHSVFYPTLAYDGSTKLLIGSYGKHTNIRPPRDIDLLFKMPADKFEKYDSMGGNGQSRLLQDIREILKDKFTTTEKINAWGKVIAINFSEGTHSVELLPGWQTESKNFKIPDTASNGTWHIWNPIAEIKNVSDSHAQTNETKSLVRMMKCWVNNCAVPIKSYVLEILVVEYFKEKFSNNTEGLSYPKMVTGFFEYLKTKRNSSVYSVGYNTYIDLKEDWFSKAESAYSRTEKAMQFEATNKLRDASLEWQKIFGTDFLIAEDKVIDTLPYKISQLAQKWPSFKEEDITKTYGYPIQINPEYKITIDATVTYQKGFAPGSLISFLERNFSLLKGNRLLFEIVQNSIPKPYSIMWKVRNFGQEAYDNDDLRGEIRPDEGYGQKKETTKYHGDHYVECYIIKDNVCVAIGKILVPIGNDYE